MKNLYYSILFVCFCFGSCLNAQSPSLSREKSAQLIKSFYEYPNLLTAEITQSANPWQVTSYQPLIDKGILQVVEDENYVDVFKFTSRGSKYLLKGPYMIQPGDWRFMVELGLREFKEVTGIKFTNDRESSAEVEYSCVISNITPFGELGEVIEGQTIDYKVLIEKYDDGWRITSPKEINYKPRLTKEQNIDRLPEIIALTKSNWELYKNGDLTNQIHKTSSGLRYIIHESGEAGTRTVKGDLVSIHYYGMFESDGAMFDNTYKRGQPYQFPLGTGQVIPGLDEGISILNKGAKATLFIPSSLGYGTAGSPPLIPGNADLIFYVELE